MAPPKVALIGLDSISPVMAERFMAAGRMPNLRRLCERGWVSEIVSTMPPTTPAAWTTIATGAWPSTHAVEGFSVHQGGEPLDQKHHSCSSDRVRAEFIWQTAERAGKRSIVLKYPMSWPPRGGGKVLQVDGAGGWGGLKCVWDLAHSGCWDTAAAAPAAAPREETANPQEWLTRDEDNLDAEGVQHLAVSAPAAWSGVPDGAVPLWETQLALRAQSAGAVPALHLLVLRRDGDVILAIAPSRDLAAAVLVRRREWSDWLCVTLPAAGGPRAGHVRFKVLELDGEGRLRLYQSQVHQRTGFTRPPAIAEELLAAAGPFAEWTEGYDRLQGWIDDATQLEIYEQHADWMCRAARHLLGSHPWDLFLSQVHFVDMAYHLYWGAIDPEHPQYDAGAADFYWDLLGKVHELADRYVGAVVDAVDDDTMVVVLGDHGHDSYHTSLLVNHLLIRHGLLTLYRDRRSGAPRIDWRRTRAYANGYRIYLNVAGRDPQGIVAPGDYRAVQQEVIQLLVRADDPRTGLAPVRLACRLEDAESLGLYGSSMGDVIFAMAPGYQARSSIKVPVEAWSGQRLQLDRVATLRQTTLFRDFTGEHDTALPFNRAIRSLLVLQGRGVRHGRRQVPVRMVDVAPTICHYLHIPAPPQCEGGPLLDALESAGTAAAAADGAGSAVTAAVGTAPAGEEGAC